MSFAKAAAELNVTPAALSFQIKGLEEHLGAPLFRRLNRAVELTEAGKALAPGASEGFDALRRGWISARRALDTRTLTVTAGPAFTAKRLAPRLFDFAQKHPDIELRFSATLHLMDFDRDNVDIAIRFGMGGEDDGVYSRVLVREWLTPMVAPQLAKQLQHPRDLLKFRLLEDGTLDFVSPPCNWPVWFRAVGVDNPPEVTPQFSHADHAIDAAETGGGAILGRVSLTTKSLQEGRLVIPFPIALTTEAHYRVLCPLGAEKKPQIQAFLTWLFETVGEFGEVDQEMTFIDSRNLAS